MELLVFFVEEGLGFGGGLGMDEGGDCCCGGVDDGCGCGCGFGHGHGFGDGVGGHCFVVLVGGVEGEVVYCVVGVGVASG